MAIIDVSIALRLSLQTVMPPTASTYIYMYVRVYVCCRPTGTSNRLICHSYDIIAQRLCPCVQPTTATTTYYNNKHAPFAINPFCSCNLFRNSSLIHISRSTVGPLLLPHIHTHSHTPKFSLPHTPLPSQRLEFRLACILVFVVCYKYVIILIINTPTRAPHFYR